MGSASGVSSPEFVGTPVVTSRPLMPTRFDVALLRRAVEVYLAHAYPAGVLPEAVGRRLDWPGDVEIGTLLETPRFFERIKSNEPGIDTIYALRLGNRDYPHMKLQVQPWPNSDGYLLSVNTHDQVQSLSSRIRDVEKFRALQGENQRIKEAIEQAWDQAGLPTFLAYLRNYIADHEAPTPGLTNPES